MTRRKEFRFPWRTRSVIRADLEEELEFHLRMRTEELMGDGLSEHDARHEAEREFGDRERTRKYCEAMDRGSDRSDQWRNWIGGLWQDLRLAARGVRLRPGYAIVVVTTLALGIGANTAVFSVLDSVLLARFPFPRSDRLVTLDELNTQTGVVRSDIAAAEYLDWTARQQSFTGIAMQAGSSLTYADARSPVLLNGRRVSANFFDVLGVRAAFGRTFTAGEDRGAKRVVILTDGAWTRLLGADRDILGKSMVLGGDSYRVVGVLPKDFAFPGYASRDYFIPLDVDAAMRDVNHARKVHFLHGFARLADGVTVEQARAELTSIAHGIERENPGVSDGHLVTILPLQSAVVGGVRPTILSLMGAAAFVLLVATANLANLALARALLRRREFAVRTALGASRARLARITLAESVSLSLVGGLIGAVIAWRGTPMLLALYPAALPPSFDVRVNGAVLAFAIAGSALTGIVFGLAPLAAVRGHALAASLIDGSRGSSAGRGHSRSRDALVVAQLALALVLVVGAGLLVQTLARLQSQDFGFEPKNVSFVWLPLSGPRYRNVEVMPEFWKTLLVRLRREPGIESVALSGSLPTAGGAGASLAIEGRPNPAPLPDVRYTVFSDGMLKTLGVRLVAGRDFNDTDRRGGQGVVLINQATASAFWPGQNPIGAHVRLGPDPAQPWSEVVGVIGNYNPDRIDAPPLPMAITMYQQDVWDSMRITVTSAETPQALQATISSAVHELDPALVVGTPTPLSSLIGNAMGDRRFAMSVLVAFSAIALLLAIVGVYGVIAYGVAARQRELGVRLALGAVPSRLVMSVLGYGARLAAVGLCIGMGTAILLTRFLSTLLFQVRPLDLATFLGAALVLGAATLAACLVPARRAASVDPVIAMRGE